LTLSNFTHGISPLAVSEKSFRSEMSSAFAASEGRNDSLGIVESGFANGVEGLLGTTNLLLALRTFLTTNTQIGLTTGVSFGSRPHGGNAKAHRRLPHGQKRFGMEKNVLHANWFTRNQSKKMRL